MLNLQHPALNKHFVGLTCAYDAMLFWLTVIVCGLQCLANTY